MDPFDHTLDYLKAVSAGAVGGYVVNVSDLPILSEFVAQFLGLFMFLLVYLAASKAQELANQDSGSIYTSFTSGTRKQDSPSVESTTRYGAMAERYSNMRDED